MSEADAENVLIEYYRRYVGDPDRTIDVYAGFGLFSAGIALGVIGVVVFLYSATLDPTAASTFAVREVAAVAGAVGLPALLFGIVVLLPVDRRMLYLAGAGIAVTLAATGAFTWAYPHNWNVVVNTDYSARIVAVYALGLVAVIGATGGALVAHRVERVAGGAGAAGAAGGAGTEGGVADASGGSGSEAAGSGGEAVTEESVRADIERELEDAELTWGGVERSETRRLELNTSAVDEADVDAEKLAGSATETRTTSGTVNDAVSELKGLQGGDVKTDSGQGTDDQAAKLRELREQQRKEAEEDDEDGSVVDRIKGLFG
ncbi:putative permease [Halorubrum distributum JCM 9100]|uniref:Putative permease n=2 Tax=Halorubrum distributum TaxID=29283 RepID=M0EVU7_9EURY|nr:permease [Halorubrum distributum]ELZ51203.1 putative permease [Halorubrum distributum JCM 9100]ELZ53002.1 putative permease [Halorubrum distributum JCM 10118]